LDKYLYLAFSDCKDPAREKEYVDWYTQMHIPDMLKAPGMIQAAFWQNAEGKAGQRRKYLALYEFETDDMQKFHEGLGKVGKGTVESGRYSELPVFDPSDVAREYVQIMPVKKAKQDKK
jgi:hypothetical protein